jgi:hypothetical protein
VVKKLEEQSEVPEQTLREACDFALIYSKAWSSNIASGSAYWVTPEQVSKTPQAGEYLAKGAFIVRGKRNFFHHLEVRAAVGIIEIEHVKKVMGGPVSAIEQRAERYVVLAFGKDRRETIAKKLAKVFEVPIEEVQAALPPGNLQIIRTNNISID